MNSVLCASVLIFCCICSLSCLCCVFSYFACFCVSSISECAIFVSNFTHFPLPFLLWMFLVWRLVHRQVLSENRNNVGGFYHMKLHSIGIVAILGACLLRKLVTIIFFFLIYLFYFKESGKNCDCTTKGFS
jgi:hypothetical protein